MKTVLATITALVLLAAPASANAQTFVSRFPGATDELVAMPGWLAQGAHGAYRHLHWRHWNSSTATARGTLDYSDRSGSFEAPIELSLSRPRYCDDGTRVYTHISVDAKRRNDRRLRSLTGGWDLQPVAGECIETRPLGAFSPTP